MQGALLKHKDELATSSMQHAQPLMALYLQHDQACDTGACMAWETNAQAIARLLGAMPRKGQQTWQLSTYNLL